MKSRPRVHLTPSRAAAIVTVPVIVTAAIAALTFLGADRASGQTAAPTADVLLGTPTVRVTATAGVSVAVLVGGAGRHGLMAEGDPVLSDGGAVDVVVRGADGGVHAIRPGERVTVTLDGRPFAAGVAPEVSGRVVPADDTVVGTIDRAGRFIARAWRPDGSHAAQGFEIGEAGVFSLSLADSIDLRPETPVEIIAPGAVMAFRSRALAERVTATLGADRLAGFAPPGATVAGTVRDDAGRAIADASGAADALGRFELALDAREGGTFRLREGDALLVAWLGRAEPLSFVVPSLSVDVEPDRGRIVGTGLAGWHVEIGMRGTGGWSTWHIPTDPSGAFALAPPDGIAPGDSGFVAMDLSERARVALPWVVPDIEVELGGAEIGGAGVGGQRIEAELVRRGFTIGRAQSAAPATGAFGIAGCARCDWRLELRDAFDHPAPILSGDVLRVGVDSGWTEVEAPPLSIDANPVTGVVAGKTARDRPIRLRLGPADEPRAEIELVSGADGAFTGAFTDMELSAGDPIGAEVRVGGVTFRVSERVWRLSLDIEDGRLRGHARPGERIVAALDREEALEGYAEGAAGPSGSYALSLMSRDGLMARPMPGDRLRVESAGRVLSVTIPPFDLSADPLLDRVFGSAPLEDEVMVAATDDRGLGGGTIQRVAERAGTAYEVALGDRFDVSGGDRILARLTTSDGDRFERRLRIPLITAQSGGSAISGFAEAEADVRASVERSGAVIAEGAAEAAADGRFALRLDDGGPPIWLASGDAITVRWEAEADSSPETLEMVIAPISTTVRAATRRVIGRVGPSADVVLNVQEPGAERWPAIAVPIPSDGRFDLRLPGSGGFAAGTILDTSTDDPFGHRTWRRATVARLEVEIAERVVRGVADPLTDYTLILLDGDVEVARATLRTDTFGAFAASLLGEHAGEGINIPGQTLMLRPDAAADSALDTALVIPPLSIDIDLEARLIHGVATPFTSIRVLLDPVGRPAASIDVPVGASGAWSLHESDFPGGIEVATLRGASARTTTRDGHLISDSAEPRTIPTATPSPVVSSTPDARETATATPSAETATATATEDSTSRFSVYIPWALGGPAESGDTAGPR